MIWHFAEVMFRAILGAVGVRVGDRKVGTCGSCHLGVWDGDRDGVRLHGEWFHKDCVKYARRGIA